MARSSLAIAWLRKWDALLEHVRLRGRDLVVDRLEVQPADEVVADVVLAVLGRLVGQQLRLDPGRLHQELLLTDALERNKPERRVVDAVPARRQQTVILMQDRTVPADLLSYGPAALPLHRH